MKTVHLSQFHYFSNQKNLKRLKKLLKSNAHLMPHQVATATGCRLDEASGVLLFLFNAEVMDASILIYHTAHESPPILKRNLLDGPPSTPFLCDICQQEITGIHELSFDVIFSKNNRFEIK